MVIDLNFKPVISFGTIHCPQSINERSMFLQVWCVPANRSRPGQHLRSVGQHPMHGQGQPRVTPPTLPRPIGGPISTTKCTSSRFEGVEIWMGLGSVASGWTQSSGRMQTCSRLPFPPHFASQNGAQFRKLMRAVLTLVGAPYIPTNTDAGGIFYAFSPQNLDHLCTIVLRAI